MREAGGQLAHGQQPLLPRHEDLHQVRLGDIGQQHHLAAPARSRRDRLTKRPLRNSMCSLKEPVEGTLRSNTVDSVFAQHRFVQQFNGGGVALENNALRIEHEHPAGQSLDQRCHARGQMLVAGVRFREVVLQLRNLAAQRIEGAGQLLGHRAEGAEGRLQIGALITRRVVIGG